MAVIESLGYLGGGHALYDGGKNLPDNRSRFGIWNHLMLVSGSLRIAIRGVVDKLPLLHTHPHGRAHFGGQVFAVTVIDEIAKGHIHTTGGADKLVAVISISNGNDPHPGPGKDSLQVAANLQVAAAEPGEILHHNGRDPAALYIPKKILEPGRLVLVPV